MQMHELSKSWLRRGISLNTESSLTLHLMVFFGATHMLFLFKYGFY